MWLIRFHLIETKDYNRVERIFRDCESTSKKYSTMILAKGIILHLLEKKSWRKISEVTGVPHVSFFHFYNEIKEKKELGELLMYFLERRILLFLGNEKHITSEYLEHKDRMTEGQREIERIFKNI